MSDYIPPPSDQIPFTFTNSGYVAKDPTSVNFSFSQTTLQSLTSTIGASVEAGQLYHNEAYTFLKERPKYVVGYETPGKVKIVYGRQVYGGIRDLYAYSKGVYSSSSFLNVYLNPETISEDFPASIEVGGIYYEQAYTYVKKCRDYIIGYGPGGVQVISAPCLYGGIRDFRLFAKGVYSSYDDLTVFLLAEFVRIKGLGAAIYSHQPSDIASAISATHKKYSDLPFSSEAAWPSSYMDLLANIAKADDAGLLVNIRVWAHSYKNISATLQPELFKGHDYLSSSIGSDQPLNIVSEIRGWSRKVYKDIYFDLVPELFKGNYYIYSYIDTSRPRNILSSIRGWEETKSQLPSHLEGVLFKGHDSFKADIFVHALILMPSNIRGWARDIYSNLDSYLNSVLFRDDLNLNAFSGGHLPEDLPSNIESVHKIFKDLNFAVESNILSGYLDIASSTGGHFPEDLNSLLNPLYREYKDITVDLKGKLITGDAYINSSIAMHQAVNLSTVISPLYKIYNDLNLDLFGKLKTGTDYITSFLEVSKPLNLSADVRSWADRFYNLAASFRSIIDTYRDLPSSLGITYPVEFPAIIRPWNTEVKRDISFEAIPIWFKSYKDLVFSIGGETPTDIRSSITAWQRKIKGNLIAELYAGWFSDDKNLPSNIYVQEPGRIRSSITAWQREIITNLNSEAIPIWFKGDLLLNTPLVGIKPRYLRANIDAYHREIERDLNSEAIPVWFKGDKELGAFSATHLPVYLRSNIRGWYERAYKDIRTPVYAHEPVILYINVGGHLPEYLTSDIDTHQPRYITSSIQPTYKKYLNLYFDSTAVWFKSYGDVYGSIGGHLPSYLYSSIKPTYKKYLNLYFDSTAVWFSSDKDIKAVIDTHLPEDIKVDIDVHLPVDIEAYSAGHLPEHIKSEISVHRPRHLTSNIASDQPRDIFFSARPFHRSKFDIIFNVFGEPRGSFADLGNIILIHSPVDLQTKLSVHLPQDLEGFIGTSPPTDLSSKIITVPPKDLRFFMAGEHPLNLSSSVFGMEMRDIYFKVNSFFAYPHDITSYIRAFQYKELPVDMHGWDSLDIASYIDKHQPADIALYLKAFQRNIDYINGDVHGWDTLDLKLVMERSLRSRNLPVNIDSHLYETLSSYLKVWPQKDIHSSLYGWDVLDLSGYVYYIYTNIMSADIEGHLGKDLNVKIRGAGYLHKNLDSYIRGFTYYDLGSTITTYSNSNLNSYLFAIKSVNIKFDIHSFDERFISAYLCGEQYPYFLTADINGVGAMTDIKSSIVPVQSMKVMGNLNSSISSYQLSDLKYNVFAVGGVNLSASVDVRLGALNLRAYIRPNIVRMTKIVDVITMEHKDITAMINTSCFGTGFREISSYIKVIYIDHLSCTINGKEYTKEFINLGASIGYDHTYIVTNSIPITINTYGSFYKAMDIFRLNISVIGDKKYLKAYVNSVKNHTNEDLGGYVKGEYIDDYIFRGSKSRIKQYKIDPYDYTHKLSKIVEISFDEVVDEYVYLSEGEMVFSEKAMDMWMTKMKSFLPANKTLGLKRRLFRDGYLSRTKNYKTLDKMIRDAIVYLTEEPSSDLCADVNMYIKSMHNNLGAKLDIRTKHYTQDDLRMSIISDDPNVWVKASDSVYLD